MATVLGLSHQTSLGTAPKNSKAATMPVEDGLGALERQGQDEGGVGVGPGGDEERDEAAAVGEVNVDVAEVGLEASSREMAEGDEGLAMSPAVLEDVALDLGIAAGVAVLVAEAAEESGRRCAAAWEGRSSSSARIWSMIGSNGSEHGGPFAVLSLEARVA